MFLVPIPLPVEVPSKLGAARLGEMLLSAVVIYLVLIGTGRLLKRRFGTRLGAVYQWFCVLAAPYLSVLLLWAKFPGRTELGAGCALLGTGVLIRLVDQYFWRWYFEKRRGATVPKFIREVAAGLLLVAVVLLIVQYGYGKPIPGLLAASGVVGIILGLAMQDALGNVIAGFALQFGRPFTVGDWLLVSDQHVRAVEINWRSTRFVNNDEVQLDVPNQQLVRQTITNFHGGGTRHAMRLELGIDSEVPPNLVKDLLKGAMEATTGVCSEPAPAALLKSFGESAVLYEVRFWINDHHFYNTTADAVRTNIWYALHRRNIRMPFATRTVHLERKPTRRREEDPAAKRRERTLKLLQEQPIFHGMGDGQLHTLMARCPPHHYGRGETIIREGQNGESMFVLLRGEAGVTVQSGENPTWVATLRTGDCFGELSLLTGAKRSANVLASNDCEVLEITKPVFADVLGQDPTILPRLSELLARRQLETEGIVAARSQRSAGVEARAQEYQASFLGRLKSFFEL